MFQTLTLLTAMLKDRKGVTAVEYAVVAGVLAAATITAFNAFGSRVNTFLAGITL